MFSAPQPGDLLMDSPRCDSWRELQTYAQDRGYWRARVRAIRQQPRLMILEPEVARRRRMGVIHHNKSRIVILQWYTSMWSCKGAGVNFSAAAHSHDAASRSVIQRTQRAVALWVKRNRWLPLWDYASWLCAATEKSTTTPGVRSSIPCMHTLNSTFVHAFQATEEGDPSIIISIIEKTVVWLSCPEAPKELIFYTY